MIPQRISFQPSVDDCVHVDRFHYWRVAMTPKALLVRMGNAVVGVLLGLLFGWAGTGGSPVKLLAALTAAQVLRIAGLPFIALIAFMAIGYPLIHRTLIPWRVRRLYAQQKSLHAPYHVIWNHEGITVETGDSRCVMPFASFRYWRESDKAFLLYQTDAMFAFVVKRAFVS